MFDYNEMVVIVTGSGSKRGIGKATAVSFAKCGATVIVADIFKEGIINTVKEIKSLGGKAMGIELDVTQEESVKAMVTKVLECYGHIDVLVNNAGISQKQMVCEMSLKEMQRVFDVNMFGLFLCTKAVLNSMKKQKFGRIINVSSAAGKRGGGFFGGAHYSASKAAILGFSKNLAREVAMDGITVNCVAPGLINTDIWKALSKEEADKIVDTIPMKRPGEPEEVASAILFLASREAAFITGEDIDINGGSHMD